MKQTVNFTAFLDAFNNAGRQDQFSYEALQAIFEYIEDYEQDTGEEVELDVIEICCNWTEATWQEIASTYDIDLSECEDEQDYRNVVRDCLDYNTQVFGVDNGDRFVYINF